MIRDFGRKLMQAVAVSEASATSDGGQAIVTAKSDAKSTDGTPTVAQTDASGTAKEGELFIGGRIEQKAGLAEDSVEFKKCTGEEGGSTVPPPASTSPPPSASQTQADSETASSKAFMYPACNLSLLAEVFEKTPACQQVPGTCYLDSQGYCWNIEAGQACVYKDVSGNPLIVALAGEGEIVPGTKALVTTLPPVTFESAPKCQGNFNKEHPDKSGWLAPRTWVQDYFAIKVVR
eukprot:scaffold114756_cov15-Tisochrysis_lutea.AAC.2